MQMTVLQNKQPKGLWDELVEHCCNPENTAFSAFFQELLMVK